jgi:hypothetical protein
VSYEFKIVKKRAQLGPFIPVFYYTHSIPPLAVRINCNSVKRSVADQDNFSGSDFLNRLDPKPDPSPYKFVQTFSNKKVWPNSGL